MSLLAPEQLTLLAALLRARLGVHFPPQSYPVLGRALATRFGGAELPPRYLDLVARDDAELERLVPLVTVGKTAFFREERHFQALSSLLPGLLARCRGEGRRLSIWSAGCSTGEEPWSIAMTAAEAGAVEGELELLASDLNPEAVSSAARGVFPARSLESLPPALAVRYFDPHDAEVRVKPCLRGLFDGAVTHNLVSPTCPRPASGAWDVVFCRNVMIYFDGPTTRSVLSRFLQVLAPGGWLFLGSAESLFQRFDGFELTETGGAFLYRRPGGAASGYTAAGATLRDHQGEA